MKRERSVGTLVLTKNREYTICTINKFTWVRIGTAKKRGEEMKLFF